MFEFTNSLLFAFPITSWNLSKRDFWREKDISLSISRELLDYFLNESWQSYVSFQKIFDTYRFSILIMITHGAWYLLLFLLFLIGISRISFSVPWCWCPAFCPGLKMFAFLLFTIFASHPVYMVYVSSCRLLILARITTSWSSQMSRMSLLRILLRRVLLVIHLTFSFPLSSRHHRRYWSAIAAILGIFNYVATNSCYTGTFPRVVVARLIDSRYS